MSYYAIKTKKFTGVETDWNKVNKHVFKVKGAVVRKFANLEDANYFLGLGAKLDQCELELQNNIKDGFVSVFVDGSYHPPYNASSYGYLIFDLNHKEHTGAGVLNDNYNAHNVTGELEGALSALTYASSVLGAKNIVLYYDFTGIEQFATNENLTQKDVNTSIGAWYKRRYDYIVEKYKINVEFKKVKSHHNVKYNNLADKLAKTHLEKWIKIHNEIKDVFDSNKTEGK